MTPLEEADRLMEDAPGKPHETQVLPAGLHQFKISREFDPWSEEIRRVAD